jgi:hypothetical protein
MEIISIVPESSLMATIKLLKTPQTAFPNEEVVAIPKANILNTHTTVVSFLQIIKPITDKIPAIYTKWGIFKITSN